MSLQFLKDSLENKNVKAFIMMIRHSEGTDAPDGYHYLFGSTPQNDRRFTDMSDHPNIREPYGNTFSTAAGALQIMHLTYLGVCAKYGIKGFDEYMQNLIGAELISERNALQKIMDGDFNFALRSCGNEWASLPNNNFGQPKHPLEQYVKWYTEAGGIIND